MRTKEQVAAEITELKALKPIGVWAKKTAQTIILCVEALESGFDDTSDEWDELTDGQQDAIRQALSWKNGETDERPSEGWGGLVAGFHEVSQS